jgi:hypothetical protein
MNGTGTCRQFIPKAARLKLPSGLCHGQMVGGVILDELTGPPMWQPSSTKPVRHNSRCATGALVLAGSVMLSWVALFNHAPLVFADSLGYATAPFRGEVPGLFSIFYSFLILPLHQGVTLWPIVFVQGAMLTHLLYLTTRCVSADSVSKPGTLLIIAGLCIFSSLPWISGQIRPDVLSPVLLLGMFLLAFCGDHLHGGELLYVSALTMVGITAHFSHVPIAFGLILLCIGMKPIFGPNRDGIWQWAALR